MNPRILGYALLIFALVGGIAFMARFADDRLPEDVSSDALTPPPGPAPTAVPAFPEPPPLRTPEIPEPTTEKLGDEEILALLAETKVSLDFANTPLDQVAQKIAAMSGVPVALDESIDASDLPAVSISLWSVELDRALGLLCTLVDLEYRIEDGRIVIATAGTKPEPAADTPPKQR